MKVCLILRADLYTPWPILRAVREIELLRSQGKEVAVVSWIKKKDSRLPAREVMDGVELVRVFLPPPKSLFMRFPAFLSVNRRLASEAIQTRSEAILVHDLEVLRAGVLAKKKLGVPLLYHAHEDWPAMVSERSSLEAKVFSMLERRYCKHVARVYVPSEGIGLKYRSWGLPVTVQYASKSVAGLPDMTLDRKRELRGRYNLADDDFVVGLAGSLGRDEAIGNILIALKGHPQKVKLLVVGGLEEKVRATRQQAEKEGLAGRVLFTGMLDTAAYMEHVGILDVGLALFLGRTLNVLHVMPIKLFDYMAMGVPVVASDLPSMRKVVEGDGGCGIIVDTQRPESIASAIGMLLENEELRLQLSSSAKRAFIDRYSWERQKVALSESTPVFG